jgi:serine phosphatase RsbU (regulator of sigma subunit)
MAKPASIRRSLLRALLLLIGSLGAGALGATLLASRTTVDALAGAAMGQTLQAADAQLDDFFGGVGRQLEVLRAWGADGLLPLDQPERLTQLLAPVLRAYPQVSGAIVADETGREHLLMRREHGWRERRLDAGSGAGRAHWREWTDAAGDLEQHTEPSDYDPRQRPWFKGALATPALHWTAPYTFYISGVHGLTVSAAWRDPTGRAHVIGFDVRLEEVSKFTTSLEPSQRGVGFVTTRDGRLLGLPRNPLFDDPEARRAALLELPEDLGIPLLSDAIGSWLAGGEPLGVPLHFRSGGEQWWGQVQPYELGAEPSALVVAVVPEADMVGDLAAVRASIAALTLIVLIIAGLRARGLAQRLSGPIETLVRRSERMGRGDLGPTEPISSPILEVEHLALAQEQMRAALRSLMKMERDLQLAREIQQHTLPEVLPEVPGFAIAAWSEAAEETGGDSYDVVGYRAGQPGQPNRLCRGRARRALCLLADAAGHGVGPALSVTQVRSMLRMALRSGAEPRWTLRHLSEQLAEDLPAGRFVTAWVGVLDADAHTLAGFSAGQAPLFLLRTASGEIEELSADAPPLGILGGEDLELPAPLHFEPGDLFAAISDGVFDLENPQGQSFGEERVREILVRRAAQGPQQVLSDLRSALTVFAAGTAARDDQTVLLIQRMA